LSDDITRQKSVWRARLGWLGGLVALFALIWAMGWPEFLKNLTLGLPQGAIIALIAIGYSMVYGIIQLINFAHGEVFMLSAYMTLMIVWTQSDFPRQIDKTPLFAPTVTAILIAGAAFTALNALGASMASLRRPERRWPLAGALGAAFGLACYAAFLNDVAAGILAAALAGLAVGSVVWAFLASRDRRPSLAGLLGVSLAAGLVLAWAGHHWIYSSSLFLSALTVSLAIAAAIGLTLDTVAYKPLRSAPRLIPLITAIGMSIFFQSLARVVWGPNPASFKDEARPFLLQQPEAIQDKDLYQLPWREQMKRGRSVVFRLQERSVATMEFLSAEDAQKARETLERLPEVDSIAAEIDDSFAMLTVRMEPNGPHAQQAVETVRKAGVEIDFEEVYSEDVYLRLLIIDVIIVVLCLTVFAALQFLIRWTKLGKAMRACAQDKTTARLVGVNVDRVVALTFAIGSMLAALVAPLYVIKYAQVEPDMGLMVGVLAFASAVLGGIGDIKGAMIGGLIIGLVYNFVPSLETLDLWPIVARYEVISPETAEWLLEKFLRGVSRWRLGVAYGVMILVLVAKPSGLFGRESAHRA
jgi:branched-subunit amino acid ABC-type transport system permease component